MYSSNYYGNAIFEHSYDNSFFPQNQIRHDQDIFRLVLKEQLYPVLIE